jgi:hypothetical protein
VEYLESFGWRGYFLIYFVLFCAFWSSQPDCRLPSSIGGSDYETLRSTTFRSRFHNRPPPMLFPPLSFAPLICTLSFALSHLPFPPGIKSKDLKSANQKVDEEKSSNLTTRKLINRELKSDNPKTVKPSHQIWQPESSFNAPKSAQEDSSSRSLLRETRKKSEVTIYG